MTSKLIAEADKRSKVLSDLIKFMGTDRKDDLFVGAMWNLQADLDLIKRLSDALGEEE